MKYLQPSPPVTPPKYTPSLVMNTQFLSAVKDQKVEGSCTANAFAAVVEYERRRAGLDAPDLSRQFIYALERIAEGTLSQDGGADPSDGITALTLSGVCPESVWPYTPADEFQAPPDAAHIAALPYRIKGGTKLLCLDDVRNCIINGGVCTVAIQVFDSFESAAVAQTGLVPYPTPSEANLGGHQIYAYGIDDTNQRLRCRNSWGDGWGDKGDFWLPYTYLASFSSEIWSIQV